MHLSATFIRRPVSTSLLSFALLLAGGVAYRLLPVSSLPEVEFPTISVSAAFPGANPETMASSIATPLERQFGHIAGVNEMTSVNQQGQTGITLQFDLTRDVNGAARDVQAAINAARSQLPANMPNNPTYKKVNPAAPNVMLIALTSKTLSIPQVFDAADSILAQRIAEVPGVGQVSVAGSAKPAVRIELNPTVLNGYGIGLEKVRTAVSGININQPKGNLADDTHRWSVSTTDQLFGAAAYAPTIITYRKGAPVRLQDIATVRDSVEDIHTGGLVAGVPSILVYVYKAPGANIIEMVDAIKAIMPQLQASIPPSITMEITLDRTVTIRAAIQEITRSLILSVFLVVLVVFLFLREGRATIIPSISVPLSLAGTFAAMYVCGYTLDNLSLMALTVSTGFVVDDAIVVVENITRYLEEGMSPYDAAMRGTQEIGPTVVSMSISLVAVFIPILLMDGIIGRLFREFAVVLSVSIAVSLVVSLTTTPMLSAKFLQPHGTRKHGWFYLAGERFFRWLLRTYDSGLTWALRNQTIVLIFTVLTIALNVYLYIAVPKGFFPQQDIGRISGTIKAEQDISFDAMWAKQKEFTRLVGLDPTVFSSTSFLGNAQANGGAYNQATLTMTLKSMEERHGETADQIIARVRPKLSHIPGATATLTAAQDLTIGGRSSAAQFQYTLTSEKLSDLQEWAPRLMAALKKLPQLQDINSDLQDQGLETRLIIDRATASRFGITTKNIDDTLFDAFGQRQVSTTYETMNQYHVVMLVDAKFQETPDALNTVYVTGAKGVQVPLSAFSHFEPHHSMLTINHQGQFPAVTISFNLSPGVALGDASGLVENMVHDMGMPASVHGHFAGVAQAFQASLASQPVLVLFALFTVYIVLGILYESFIHPLTILSTLPSAGVGAMLALLVFKMDLNVIAMIGIILLIGIVKKNAIMMIDFALDAERNQGMAPQEAIHRACLLRFRPILMTTMAALLGGVPLAFGTGTGAELRRPLGITIVGGLIVSQMLTLFTTPVVYLFFDRLQQRFAPVHPIEPPEHGHGRPMEDEPLPVH